MRRGRPRWAIGAALLLLAAAACLHPPAAARRILQNIAPEAVNVYECDVAAPGPVCRFEAPPPGSSTPQTVSPHGEHADKVQATISMLMLINMAGPVGGVCWCALQLHGDCTSRALRCNCHTSTGDSKPPLALWATAVTYKNLPSTFSALAFDSVLWDASVSEQVESETRTTLMVGNNLTAALQCIRAIWSDFQAGNPACSFNGFLLQWVWLQVGSALQPMRYILVIPNNRDEGTTCCPAGSASESCLRRRR
jgi:hypothetical protein